MEMEEHSPSHGKSDPHPIARCERPLSHLYVWSPIRCECVGCGWLLMKSAHIAPLDKSLGNPINSLSRPCCRCQPSQNISL